MKFLISTVLIAIASTLMQIVLPWWSLALAGFIIGIVVPLPSFKSFLSGLLGTAIVWWVYALMIHFSTDALLSNKMAMMFHASPLIIILISGFLAGIVGGFATASGSALRTSFDEQTTQ